MDKIRSYNTNRYITQEELDNYVIFEVVKLNGDILWKRAIEYGITIKDLRYNLLLYTKTKPYTYKLIYKDIIYDLDDGDEYIDIEHSKRFTIIYNPENINKLVHYLISIPIKYGIPIGTTFINNVNDLLNNCDNDFWNNSKYVLFLTKYYGDIFFNRTSNELKSNKEFMLKAMKYCNNVQHYNLNKIITNENIDDYLFARDNNYRHIFGNCLYRYADESLKSDKDFLIQTYKININIDFTNDLLQYANEDLKNDNELYNIIDNIYYDNYDEIYDITEGDPRYMFIDQYLNYYNYKDYLIFHKYTDNDEYKSKKLMLSDFIKKES